MIYGILLIKAEWCTYASVNLAINGWDKGLSLDEPTKHPDQWCFTVNSRKQSIHENWIEQNQFYSRTEFEIPPTEWLLFRLCILVLGAQYLFNTFFTKLSFQFTSNITNVMLIDASSPTHFPAITYRALLFMCWKWFCLSDTTQSCR